MRLGRPRSAAELRDLYFDQANDFAKLWLYADGPRAIAGALAASLDCRPLDVSHPCRACRSLFRDEPWRSALVQRYPEHVVDVLWRLSVRTRLANASVLNRPRLGASVVPEQSTTER